MNVSSRSSKALVLSSTKALTTLVGIISAAVLARMLSKSDYASYRQTLLAYTFAVPFATLGFDRALYYFLPGEEKRSRGILVENLFWLWSAGTMLSLFLLLGGNRFLAVRFNNPDLACLLLLLTPYPVLMLPATSLPACLMARNRTQQVAGFNVGSRLLMLLAIVVPCLLWPSPSVAIIGTVLGAGVTTAAALTLMFRACNAGSWHPTISGILKQVRFSVPLGLASLLGTVSLSLGQVMVAAFCSAETFALYVNGAIEIPLIGIITDSVTSVLIVDYARLHKEGRLEEIVALIRRAMVKCALVLIPAMAFLLCTAPELMRLLFGKPYEGSAVFFRVYLLLLPARTLTFGAIFTATGNSHYTLIQTIIGVIGQLIATWCGIHWFGAMGAASASVVTVYLIVTPYLLIVLRKILRRPIRSLFPWRDLAKVVVASFVPAIVILFLRHLIHGLDAVFFAVAGTAYTVLAVLFLSWLGYLSLPRLYSRAVALIRWHYA